MCVKIGKIAGVMDSSAGCINKPEQMEFRPFLLYQQAAVPNTSAVLPSRKSCRSRVPSQLEQPEPYEVCAGTLSGFFRKVCQDFDRHKKVNRAVLRQLLFKDLLYTWLCQ